jgi:predicted nucleotidyltransferase
MERLDLKPDYLKMLLGILKTDVPDAEVWAFGSRVNGDGHDCSDLDLVIRNPIDLERPQRQLSRLRGALSDSRLPILVDVRDWAWLPEESRREIQRRYVIVQSASAAAKAPTK